jgi:hypothetical protein
MVFCSIQSAKAPAASDQIQIGGVLQMRTVIRHPDEAASRVTGVVASTGHFLRNANGLCGALCRIQDATGSYVCNCSSSPGDPRRRSCCNNQQICSRTQLANTPAPTWVQHSLQRDPTAGLLACSVSGTSQSRQLQPLHTNPVKLPRMSTLGDLSQHRVHNASKPHTGVKTCGGSCIKRRCRNVRVSRVRNPTR